MKSKRIRSGTRKIVSKRQQAKNSPLLGNPYVKAGAMKFQDEDGSLSDLHDGSSSKVTNVDHNEAKNLSPSGRSYREDGLTKEQEVVYEEKIKEREEKNQLEVEALRWEVRRVEERYQKKMGEALFEAIHLKALLRMSERERMALQAFQEQEREANKEDRRDVLMEWGEGEKALQGEIEEMKKERETLDVDFKAKEEKIRKEMQDMELMIKELEEDKKVLLSVWECRRECLNL